MSVIIPTLNEADYVGYLLFSLSRQTYRQFEVIVSDGGSPDQTKKIATSFKNQLPSLKFVVSHKRSPAFQRNRGAEVARYEQLLFLDADTILPPDFLEKSLGEIKKRKLDLAHPVSFPLTKRVADQYLYLVTNWGLEAMQNVFPLAGGWTIFAKKSIHQKIGGFDERLRKIAEDTDYVTRAVKTGARFGIIKNCSPFVSVRRLDIEGTGGAFKNMLLQGIYFSLFGKYRAQDLINRPYGRYTFLKKNKKRLLSSLKKFFAEIQNA